MPACSHPAPPRPFHSSTASGSACLISARTWASVSPRQPPSSAIRPSISSAGDCRSLSRVALLLLVAMTLFHLVDADVVAGGVAERAVADPVGLVGRFLNDVGATRRHPLERGVEIAGGQDQPGVAALRHQL